MSALILVGIVDHRDGLQPRYYAGISAVYIISCHIRMLHCLLSLTLVVVLLC